MPRTEYFDYVCVHINIIFAAKRIIPWLVTIIAYGLFTRRLQMAPNLVAFQNSDDNRVWRRRHGNAVAAACCFVTQQWRRLVAMTQFQLPVGRPHPASSGPQNYPQFSTSPHIRIYSIFLSSHRLT